MKANEAPEKIYINDFGSELSYDWHTEHCCESDIEYTRTDAFIEKACEWLEDNLYDYAGDDDKRNIVPFDKSIFEDFKNYMKGE